ncbi:MAG: hypothetical protein ACOCRX_06260 [Candidatus Woesearchaeota archaeon]
MGNKKNNNKSKMDRLYESVMRENTTGEKIIEFTKDYLEEGPFFTSSQMNGHIFLDYNLEEMKKKFGVVVKGNKLFITSKIENDFFKELEREKKVSYKNFVDWFEKESVNNKIEITVGEFDGIKSEIVKKGSEYYFQDSTTVENIIEVLDGDEE